MKALELVYIFVSYYKALLPRSVASVPSQKPRLYQASLLPCVGNQRWYRIWVTSAERMGSQLILSPPITVAFIWKFFLFCRTWEIQVCQYHTCLFLWSAPSLLKGRAHLLCIIPVLVYVLLKRAPHCLD